jgi:hypothetical protein
MAISVGDAALLRAANHRTEMVLNAVPLVQVATARINQATFAYPLAEVVVDTTSGAWLTAVKVGQAFAIGTTAGGTDITWGVVRKVPTSTIFYFDAKSLGDSGYARDIRGGLADNLYLTVYKHRPMWGLLSAIRNSTFYKQFDVPYVDQGSSPPPVCLIGKHRQAFVDTVTNKATFAFSAAESFAWGSKTISSYSWSLDGGTLASGSLTAATLTAEFDPGFYVVTCTITDSDSKTHTAFRYVWANSRTGSTAPFGALHPWQIGNDRQDATGRSVDLTLTGNFTEADIYPGQSFHLFEYAYFNGSALTDDSVRVSNALLYASERSISRTRSTPSVNLQLTSPLALAKAIPAATQQINEQPTATDWTEVTSVLSHPPGAAWYILQHHCPTMLAAHDYRFNATLKTLRKKSFVMQADSIGGQLAQIAEMLPGGIGCRSDGTLVLAMSPMVLNNTDRNALDNKFTWNEGDVIPPLTYPARYLPPTGLLRGYAFSFGGGAEATPYASQAPGKSQAQGTSKGEATYIVTDSGGQTRVNEICGHLYAVEAARTPEFGFRVDRNIDIAEPADLDVWHTFNVSTSYDPMGEGWTNKRVIPKRVTRAYNGSVKTVTVDWQIETFGQPGVTMPVERGGAGNWVVDGFNLQIPVEFDPLFDDAFALAWNDVGVLARTANFNGLEPHWELITDGLTGLVNDMALDYGSSFFVNGIGDLGAWVVTTTGTTLSVYYAPDVRTSLPVWELQDTFTMNDSTVTLAARIASSKTTIGFVMLAWKDQTGTLISRTTDSGASWSGSTRAGSSIIDLGVNDNAEIGLAIDGIKQLVTAPDGTGQYYLYLATTTAGAFSQLTDSPDSARPYPLVIVDGEGRAFTKSYPSSLVNANLNVTFDSGGSSYSFTPDSYSPDTTLAVVTGGFAGNGGRMLITPLYFFGSYVFGVQGDFLDIVDVTSASFRYKINPSDGSYISGSPNTYAQLIYVDNAGGILRTVNFAVTADNTWRSISEAVAVSGCRYVICKIFTTINLYAPSGGMFVMFDDLQATRVATLYRVSTYAGTPSWVDITPTGHEPEYPYALALDPLNLQRMIVVANGFTAKRYTTINRGTAWTDNGDLGLSYRGVKVLGDQIVLFGTSAIDYSEDGGASFASKLGDWNTSVGAIGTFRGMWCII